MRFNQTRTPNEDYPSQSSCIRRQSEYIFAELYTKLLLFQKIDRFCTVA